MDRRKLAVLISGGGEGQPSLLNDIKAYLTLNEASGNRLDSTGRGNTFAPTGAVGSAAGVVGNGATFGAGKTLRNAGTADLRFPTSGDFTMAFWLKTGATVTTCYLYAGDTPVTTSGFAFLILTNAIYIRSIYGGVSSLDAAAAGTIAINSTYLIVFRAKAITGGYVYSVKLNSGEVKTTNVGPAASSQPVWLGGYTSQELPADSVLDEFGIWNRWLSDVEIAEIATGITYPFTGQPSSAGYYKKFYHVNGDSLSDPAYAVLGGQIGWSAQVDFGSPSPNYLLSNVAASGRTMAQVNTQTTATLLRPSYEKNYAVIWAGTNDIASGAAAATAYASFTAACTKLHNAGFQIIALTTLPRTSWASGSQAVADAYNALIKGDASYYDALVDVALYPHLTDPSNSTYYLDGTHLKTAGYADVAAGVQSAINGLA